VKLTLLIVVLSAQTGNGAVHAVFDGYIRALGGEAALRSVATRTTEGRFENGRGLRVPFRTMEKAPNKRVTILGTQPIAGDQGSGRGYDGHTGWDRNFVGTGLRTLEHDELEDLAREADMLRPLHLERECVSPRVDPSASRAVIVTCQFGRRTAVLHFDRVSGLLVRQDLRADARLTLSSIYEDYRDVAGVKVPFRLRFTAPGADVSYFVERVRTNEAIDDRSFTRP